MKTINVKLDPHSIEKAIQELQEYKAEVERRVELLVRTLTEQGADLARAKLMEYDAYNSGELYNSVEGVITENYGVIRVNSEYALFIEFGTGPIGAKNPHPSGGGTYRNEPWVTAADGKPMDLMYGWEPIPLVDGGVIYQTYGQKSKPFMWETAQQLRENLEQTAKEIFND